jgi:hypothetical protein
MKMTIIIIGPKGAIANVSIVLVAEVHNGKNGRTVPWLVYRKFYRKIFTKLNANVGKVQNNLLFLLKNHAKNKRHF